MNFNEASDVEAADKPPMLLSASFSGRSMNGAKKFSPPTSQSTAKSRSASFTERNCTRSPAKDDSAASFSRKHVVFAELRADQKKLTLSLDKRIQLEAAVERSSGSPKSFFVSSLFAFCLAALAGIFVVVQTGINTSLRRTVVPSALATSVFSFCFGLAVSTLICLVHKFPRQGLWPIHGYKAIPWYAYTGGVLGAGFVTSAIYLAPELGFATFQLAVVAGQLLSGLVCDTVGFLHLSPSPPTPWRIMNVTAVLVGTALSAKWKGWSSGWQAPIYIIIAAIAGGIFPIQACVNWELGHHVGTPFRAVAFNFGVGFVILWLAVLVETASLGADRLVDFSGQDDTDYSYKWWFWMGGCFGALLIAAVTIGIPAIGAVPFTVVFISTQLLGAVVADATGAFGYEIVPLNAFGGRRIVGVLVALIAAMAFKAKPPKIFPWLDAPLAGSRISEGLYDLDQLDFDSQNGLSTSFHASIKIPNEILDADKGKAHHANSITHQETDHLDET